MEPHRQRERKTYKYKLKPTPQQAQALATVVQLCRTLYNTALEQWKTSWERGQGKSATCTTSRKRSCQS
jgi:transposase